MSTRTVAGRTNARNDNPIRMPQIGRPNGVTGTPTVDERPSWAHASGVAASPATQTRTA